jgi:peptide deformylase
MLSMKGFLISIVIMSLMASCAGRKFIQPHSSSIFNKDETRMIMQDDSLTPMRLYLITRKEDSIILRRKSKNFKVNPQDPVLKHFIRRLYATVTDSSSRGVGIAAPQVGILKRIIWVQRLDKIGEPFEVYYNPYIQQYSTKKQDVPEGCLSIPGYRATTTDISYAVLLRYDNVQGEHKCEMVEDFTAAIFQHEIDHLNGILFIDHLNKEKKSIQHSLK